MTTIAQICKCYVRTVPGIVLLSLALSTAVVAQQTEPEDEQEEREVEQEETVKPEQRAREESVRKYRTRNERLEAGEERQLSKWVYSTTLAEVEWERETLTLKDNPEEERETASVLTLIGGIRFAPSEAFEANVVLEYDSELDDTIVDEAVMAATLEPFEVEIGKQNLPFGEYFSRFNTGPMLEFGDTADVAAKLSYSLEDKLELSLTGYEGLARSEIESDSDIDYVAAAEYWPTDSLALGLSYITDLADSEVEFLLDNDNRFLNKVPAASGYALWVADKYEISFEYVRALEDFEELDEDRNRPSAWNLELGLFVVKDVDLAFRIEGSKELDDEPEIRAGASMTLLINEKTTFTLEVLRGGFMDGFVTDDDDNSVDNQNILGLQFSFNL